MLVTRVLCRGAHGWRLGQRRHIQHCSALVYREHSHNINTVRMEQLPLPPVGDHSVKVRMLAAPVNPADINMIQGSYPILCPIPAVGGNEGVGEVLEVGSDVTSLRPGDWVVPIDAGFGTWRTAAVCEEDELISIPKDISVLGAATIFVNPCTAYRMLHDFQTLSPGNTVIQNASNSAVGQAVIQIAAALGLKTINIIRDRENCDQLMQELQSLGADYVVTEEEVMSSGLHQLFEEVPKPKLGLNCVGGLSGGLVLSNLDYGGTMVTYGGMAKRPLQIPAKSFIFHNVTLKGFWLTQWKRQHRTDKAKLTAMLDAVCELMRAGRLSAPNCVHTPFHQFTHALQATTQTHSRKHVLIM
ncbi:enoyl-[acyl-carrier-protein] reductase, mitochondrial isoform X1 [Danio rerio]|uniref:Enoyl-[acyl-carrier-protein] reductase, mitochondrial n=1 Tax=Danio rerio TaxID=7955 RepID=E7EYZ5_DANRE|nr:enoyl-[acyl-carrier-protein] reductase, mitochondrial-like isoform X1 [Danio rerio]|eukprot:XP_005173854.2 enoyl-[acyl-carrier-protein] reductase, mitochondrial-like isoform X1 [Danio rerio]